MRIYAKNVVVFPHSVAHLMFPCVAWYIITDRADKPVLLKSTRNRYENMDLALSLEVNRQGQSKQTIPFTLFLLKVVF